MTTVFVVNSGSSSIKWELLDAESGSIYSGGIVERIGEPGGGAANHDEGMHQILAGLGNEHPAVVGHRVVHGGAEFTAATVITDEVERRLDEISVLAPLHNPENLKGIRAARAAFADVPHVAVFDTAFHGTLPPEAFTYAIDADVAREHGIRRYGFHGTSYRYVAGRAAAMLGRDLADLKLIVFHLGNGASVCAIDGGRSIDTSMGMTPLEGLVMGTRSGDIDPGALFHLGRAGMTLPELDQLLNRRSGLLGMTGTGDMRDVQSAADAGDETAKAALAVYYHRLRHYLGAYLVALGGADAIVFTAGVGENSAATRRETVAGLEGFGIALDVHANSRSSTQARVISRNDSAVKVLIIPTNEELQIAREAVAAVSL
ncbi:acetate kinase [Salinibacterium sp. TMP30]|uniref:acetate/propionate family kinase n=1 Tax=Salinibacterium sp. TMP30 TaxID=3138237 RepID=UPI00313A2AAC